MLMYFAVSDCFRSLLKHIHLHLICHTCDSDRWCRWHMFTIHNQSFSRVIASAFATHLSTRRHHSNLINIHVTDMHNKRQTFTVPEHRIPRLLMHQSWPWRLQIILIYMRAYLLFSYCAPSPAVITQQVNTTCNIHCTLRLATQVN